MDDKFWYFHFLILKYISSNSTCRTIFIITIGIICFGKVDSDRKKGYSVLMITKGNPQMYFNIPNWRFTTIGKGSSVMCKAMNKIIIKKSISKITKKDIMILLIFYQSILLNKLIIICYVGVVISDVRRWAEVVTMIEEGFFFCSVVWNITISSLWGIRVARCVHHQQVCNDDWYNPVIPWESRVLNTLDQQY